MALTFDFINSIIEVPLPDTSIDIQTLLNEIRDMEDELNPSMSYPKIADAFGKQDLSGGVQVGITLVLLNNWKLRFAARLPCTDPTTQTVACEVTGGNLVAVSGNPIAAAACTSVTVAQSSSPTIATPESDTNLLYLVESLISKNRGVGTYYYWDPYGGSDTAAGTKPSTAVATFTKAQTLATAGSNDVIFCMSTNPSGVTTVTETLNITKNNLRVRGPGYAFQIIPTADTTDTIAIAANSVEVSGLYLQTAATGTNDGISIDGNSNVIKDCWITNVRGHGIAVTGSARTEITNCAIEDCGTSGTGNGINITNSTIRSLISKCIISGNINGIAMTGSGITDNTIENNLVYNHSGYGITVGSGVLRTHVRSGHTFNKNTTGNTQDLGTDTYIESQAGGASASEIADAVWDEVISGHVTAGTAGRTLRDAKTRATLASLK